MEPTVNSGLAKSQKFLNTSNWVVHLVRILVKAGLVVALFVGQTTYFLPLTLHIILSEILDQIFLIFSKKNETVKKLSKIVYPINSVLVINAVAYFANWIENDFYLIYLVHISSASVGYGYRTGIFSSALSVASYSLLLLHGGSEIEYFLRLPLLSILVLRQLLSQFKFEKTDQYLKEILGIEKSKQDFIALASHNLRTPVAAIYGYIEILLRGDFGKLNDRQSVFVDRIRNNNQELEKLTEQLLQISIFEVGKANNLFKQAAQVEVILEEIIEKLRVLAEDKKITLDYQRNSLMLPLIQMDVEKMQSVLVNLIENAIKYTDKGGIKVMVNQEDNWVVISISDTGIGIPTSDLPKLFNKFYRSGNVLIYNKSGIGLGLYIGKQVVELHGGKMAVDSVEGKGSTFRVYLPVAK